jgi:Family of unknown function (DUF5675)
MDLILQRDMSLPSGIFGSLKTLIGNFVAVTLEHSFEKNDDFVPALSEGVYTCKRGLHQLQGMRAPFETFEITNVPGHTGLLFHIGNYNRDTDGCVLLGEEVVINQDHAMITKSIESFGHFMTLQTGVDTFILRVI